MHESLFISIFELLKILLSFSDYLSKRNYQGCSNFKNNKKYLSNCKVKIMNSVVFKISVIRTYIIWLDWMAVKYDHVFTIVHYVYTLCLIIPLHWLKIS